MKNSNELCMLEALIWTNEKRIIPSQNKSLMLPKCNSNLGAMHFAMKQAFFSTSFWFAFGNMTLLHVAFNRTTKKYNGKELFLTNNTAMVVYGSRVGTCSVIICTCFPTAFFIQKSCAKMQIITGIWKHCLHLIVPYTIL